MKRFVLPILILCVFAIVFIGFVNAVIVTTTRPYIYTDISKAPTVQAVLILGSSVTKNQLMPVALDRTETAIEVIQAGKTETILVSGDNSTLSYNEVIPVKKYLIEKGIPEEVIVLDYAGFDTYDSLYRAKNVFGASSVLIVTQSFHLPRAVYIARSLGLNAFGISADRREYRAKNYAREWFASLKAVIEVRLGAKSKFANESHNVFGTGEFERETSKF